LQLYSLEPGVFRVTRAEGLSVLIIFEICSIPLISSINGCVEFVNAAGEDGATISSLVAAKAGYLMLELWVPLPDGFESNS
jgi:hypothetical protein